MVRIKRTTAKNRDFQNLIMELDSDLQSRYSSENYQYNAYTNLGNLQTVVVAYIQDIAVGCGCFKELDVDTVEIKRMFVNPYFRGFGVASSVIEELLDWAKRLYYKQAVLETGIKQPESIKLYAKHGFTVIDNFGPYKGMEESVCMRRFL
ncbi:GNAT family N-acetyltransferase [Pedobacter sp. SYSU D00535]|uniref:GNAT family N-acetyltransferase n=1 Tax=Pedobacter sp. SYSU D00535 TaxID=2810308 RepID=UPI001A95DDB4|nr:GNAT family N-acetyltransferase [Pedobacter sp. SYSU D00535]